MDIRALIQQLVPNARSMTERMMPTAETMQKMHEQVMTQYLKQLGLDNDENEDPIEKHMPRTLRLLYAASKMRIYKLADKIAANEVTNSMPKLSDHENAISVPVADSWDFKLGDWVRIKYSLPDYKSIQSQTLGWNARLRTIHGCIGVVTARWSPYQNGVTVYMPERLSTSSIYAGLLEKVSEDERKEDKSFTTQWKVNEYVQTILDPKVVGLMQKRLDTIPKRYIGRKGRIIAVTRVAIVVTFNNRTSYDINSSLLMKCHDQSPLDIPQRTHDKLSLGEKVRVLSNVTQLVKNQGDAKWNANMTQFVGKEVRIIHIRKDKRIRVQYKLGTDWVINSESVQSLNDPMQQTGQEDCEFMPGDIVKIKMTSNMRYLLQKKNVPMIFLDYLRNTARVKLIDDDFDYLIKYNNDQNVAVYPPTIRKATIEEKAQHERVTRQVKDIRKGTKVCLDVGPPSFVKEVLQESNAPADVVYALTHPSTLIGFAEDCRAVIQYEGGKTYKVKKHFLTVPERFNLQGRMDGMDFETAKEIQDAVSSCVKLLREDDDVAEGKENPVRILGMSFDATPTIDLRVYSVDASVDRISEKLLTICDWDARMRIAADDVIYVKGLESFDREIKITFYFNHDPYQPVNTTAHSPPLPVARQTSYKVNDEIREDFQTVKATPTTADGAAPNERQADGPQVEPNFNMIPPQHIQQFDYIPVPFAGADNPVYIPYYFPDGQRRAFINDNQSRQRRQAERRDNRPTNIIHIDRIDSFNNINN